VSKCDIGLLSLNYAIAIYQAGGIVRFDLIANFSPGETIPWPRVLEMIREQCSLAEQAAFTTAWFTEHHFAHNGYMNAPPNPIQLGTHIAAHCQNLRVGTAPIVLPDWHPLLAGDSQGVDYRGNDTRG